MGKKDFIIEEKLQTVEAYQNNWKHHNTLVGFAMDHA